MDCIKPAALLLLQLVALKSAPICYFLCDLAKAGGFYDLARCHVKMPSGNAHFGRVAGTEWQDSKALLLNGLL